MSVIVSDGLMGRFSLGVGSGDKLRSRGRGSRLDEPRGLPVVSQRLDRVRKAEGTEAHREGK